MGYLRIEVVKPEWYQVQVNPSDAEFLVEEASELGTFESCLSVILKHFITRHHFNPSLTPVKLEIKGNMPLQQQRILENIVALHNRVPELYATIADPKQFRSIAEYYGHTPPKAGDKS